MIRHPKVYSTEEVLSRIQYKQCDKELMTEEQIEASRFRRLDDRKFPELFDGHQIKMSSSRLRTFSLRGLACVTCGIVGSRFYKERDINAKNFHLNLYALNKDGAEILMTKDHILPKFWGGPNHIENYQTMCTICNSKKGHKKESDE